MNAVSAPALAPLGDASAAVSAFQNPGFDEVAFHLGHGRLPGDARLVAELAPQLLPVPASVPSVGRWDRRGRHRRHFVWPSTTMYAWPIARSERAARTTASARFRTWTYGSA